MFGEKVPEEKEDLWIVCQRMDDTVFIVENTESCLHLRLGEREEWD